MSEYIVVQAQLVGNPDHEYGTAYYSDLKRFERRKDAITHGYRTLGHDDFLIATVDGKRVLATGWMHEDHDDPGDARGIEREFGWT